MTYKQDDKVDFTLPEGMGGYTKPYITRCLSKGVNVGVTNVFFTYKRDDLINLWEGSGHEISGYAYPVVRYKPHAGIIIKDPHTLINKRCHDGIDIKDIHPYVLYKQEDKVDSFTIPYGISGWITPFITLNIRVMCSYINNLNIDKIKSIVIGNTYFPLKDIQALNSILLQNNNTIKEEIQN